MPSKYPPKKPAQHIFHPAPKRDWSEFQKDIFRDIHSGVGHTVVIARAGSGKTSTIIEGFKYLPKGKKTLMVAFNKAIAEELKERAPSYVEVSTLHALGYRAIRLAFGNTVVLDNNKSHEIIKQLIGDDNDLWEVNQSLAKCVSLCKGSLADTPIRISEIIDKFDIETFEYSHDKFIELVIKTLSLSKEQKLIINFDDMIWFPFVYRLNVGKFDIVFLDEAQDTNRAQMAMVLSASKVDGRIIAVGDPAQAIYQFIGADTQSIPNLINKLGAKTLPLPITYRCPRKVVAMAKEIVPDIEPSINAKEGEIEEIYSEDLLKLVRPGDFVLSRTNAPLIKYCLQLLKAGVPANIQGRDIGSNLLYFIKKSKAKTIDKLIDYINSWRETETKRLLSEKKDTTICIDKSECLLNLCEGTLTIKDLKSTIENLFNDVSDNAKVVLSSTHKSKGLERDRVFVLTNTYRYVPSMMAGTEENCLWYVAITRCRSNLFLVRKHPKQ